MNLTRPLAAALGSLLLLGGWAAGHAGASGASTTTVTTVPTNTTPGSEPVTAPFRVASYNIRMTVSPEDAVSDLQALVADGVDVMTLQEMASPERRQAVRAALLECETCEFDAYMPLGDVYNSTPILFRSTRFVSEGQGTRKVSDATYVGPGGAGPSTIRAKYVNYVQLRDEVTGQTVYVLNNHAVPSVQAKDGSANEAYPKRLELYRKHMAGLKSLVTELRATGATVFVTGDLNVNYRKDRVVRDKIFPWYNLRQVGVVASHEALGEPRLGTHVRSGDDTRLIDYVSYMRHASVTPVSQRVLTGYRSDHRPIVVDFSLVGPGALVAPTS